MPETFGRVRRILSLLEERGAPPATLLVVPGKEWTSELLDELRLLGENGHALAGHGWCHKATPGPRSLYHRLHSALVSRNEAEHLSRSPTELVARIRRCYEWFPSVDLPEPDLYVPPAWAMGALPLSDLGSLPFRWYEILRGFVDGATGRVSWLPLAGFEADTTFRELSLRLWNGLNVVWARRVWSPLRISIHPFDLDLLLAGNLEKMVQAPWTFVREPEIFGKRPPGEAS